MGEQRGSPETVPSSGTSAASWAVFEFLLSITFSVLFDVHRRKKVGATVDSFLVDRSVLSSHSLCTW